MTGRPLGAGVELIDVTKRYGQNSPAVDGVSMSIEPGEFVTFLGPSGSGKTTTLNIIAGFTSPTSGRVLLEGQDVVKRPTHKRNLGMVFQNYALFPHLSVRANVAYGLQRRRVDRVEARTRVEEALDMVRLGGYGDRMPRQLSGGQQQRVALARALVYRPSVLLMDEPLGALDKNLRDQMQVEIARLHRELGTTFLFVTHDQDEALALSNRIALFDAGRIVQLDTAEGLYERPTSLFAAEFLGHSTIFRGTVNASGDLDSDGATLALPARHGHAPGTRAAVIVRPERMTIAAQGWTVAGRGTNVVAALVTDVSYLGASRRIGLRFADGSTGVVRESAGHHSDAGIGSAVEVTWPVDHGVVVALPADGAR